MRGITRLGRSDESKIKKSERRGYAPPQPVRVALTAPGSQTPTSSKMRRRPLLLQRQVADPKAGGRMSAMKEWRHAPQKNKVDCKEPHLRRREAAIGGAGSPARPQERPLEPRDRERPRGAGDIRRVSAARGIVTERRRRRPAFFLRLQARALGNP